MEPVKLNLSKPIAKIEQCFDGQNPQEQKKEGFSSRYAGITRQVYYGPGV